MMANDFLLATFQPSTPETSEESPTQYPFRIDTIDNARSTFDCRLIDSGQTFTFSFMAEPWTGTDDQWQNYVLTSHYVLTPGRSSPTTGEPVAITFADGQTYLASVEGIDATTHVAFFHSPFHRISFDSNNVITQSTWDVYPIGSRLVNAEGCVLNNDTPTINGNTVTCVFSEWMSFQSVKLFKHNHASAYMFATERKSIDADGAPNAYHPDDIGLDRASNAGYPNANWWDMLVRDPTNPNQPYRQTEGTFKGYFVSTTALFDRTRVETDPERYVDARTVPYLVFPKSFYEISGTGSKGDFGYAINLKNQTTSPFIVADIGPRNAELGEISIALAEGLGGSNVNPRNGAGAPQGKVVYVVFPKSAQNPAWPVSFSSLDSIVQGLLANVGGESAILNCVNQL